MSYIEPLKRSISLGLSAILVFTLVPGASAGTAYQTTEPAPASSTASTSSYPGQGVPSTADELQSLVAPIAASLRTRVGFSAVLAL